MENTEKMQCKEAFFHYGIQLPRRFIRREKDYFLRAASVPFSNAGYQTTYTSRKIKGKNPANLYIGDVQKADTLIIAGYDTPAHNFGNPYTYYPLDGRASMLASLLPTLTPLLLAFMGVLYIFITYAKDFDLQNRPFFTIFCIVLTILLSELGFYMSHSIGNNVNMNRNTSGVVAAMMIAQGLNKKAKNKVAFILSDDTCSGHKGDYLNREMIKNLDSKKIILLDCLGKGDQVFVGYGENSSKLAKSLESVLEGCQLMDVEPKSRQFSSFSFYPSAVCICKASKETTGIPSTATKKDDTVDDQGIEILCSQIADYLNDRYQ